MSRSRAGSGALRGLETRDSLAVIPEHDSLDMVELRVEAVERRVHAVECPRDPQRLEPRERRQGGDNRRSLRPLHTDIVPAVSQGGKMAEAATRPGRAGGPGSAAEQAEREAAQTGSAAGDVLVPLAQALLAAGNQLPELAVVLRPASRRKVAVSDYVVAGAAASARANRSSPSSAEARTVSPSPNRPSSRASASGFSSRRWIARFSGRAP